MIEPRQQNPPYKILSGLIEQFDQKKNGAKCFAYNGFGHLSYDCPNPTRPKKKVNAAIWTSETKEVVECNHLQLINTEVQPCWVKRSKKRWAKRQDTIAKKYNEQSTTNSIPTEPIKKLQYSAKSSRKHFAIEGNDLIQI